MEDKISFTKATAIYKSLSLCVCVYPPADIYSFSSDYYYLFAKQSPLFTGGGNSIAMIGAPFWEGIGIQMLPFSWVRVRLLRFS